MRWFAMCLVVALGWMWFGSAGEALAAPARNKKQKPQTYAVVRIGNELKVMASSSLKQERKSLAKKYKDDMQKYKDAKKDAAEDKDAAKGADHGAALKMPERSQYHLMVLKSSIKTQGEADTFVDKYIEEHPDQGLKAQKAVAGIGALGRNRGGGMGQF